MGLLSLAIWTPIAFGVLLLALGRDDQAKSVRWFALLGSLISLLVTLPLVIGGAISLAVTGSKLRDLHEKAREETANRF